MRGTVFVLVGAIGLAGSALQARSLPRRASPTPSRMVQVIDMSAGGSIAAGEEGAVPPSTESPPPPPLDRFHVHELSRRWVEDQMRSSFAPAGADPLPAPRADDPFAPQQFAAASRATTAGPSSSPIAVPSWMLPAASSASGQFMPGCAAAPYRPTGFLRFDAEARRQTYYGLMSSIACQYGLPVGLFDAMIIRESRYDPSIVSPKQAFGLTQLMPGTAAGLGVNRFDIAQNLRGGASYLRQQLDRFGQYHLALAAYNAGPGRVLGTVPDIPETRAYVDDILRNWSRLSGAQKSVIAQRLSTRAAATRDTFVREVAILSF